MKAWRSERGSWFVIRDRRRDGGRSRFDERAPEDGEGGNARDANGAAADVKPPRGRENRWESTAAADQPLPGPPPPPQPAAARREGQLLCSDHPLRHQVLTSCTVTTVKAHHYSCGVAMHESRLCPTDSLLSCMRLICGTHPLKGFHQT